ncbi:MAG: HEAT repeat domain-containing protein [Planctomycetota bacterium]
MMRRLVCAAVVPRDSRGARGYPLRVAGVAVRIAVSKGFPVHHFKRRRALLVTAALIALPALSGCMSLETALEKGREGKAKDRRKAVARIAQEVSRGLPDELGDQDPRQRVNSFLHERFSEEPDPLLRARILSVAVEGGFACAKGLIVAAARDEEPVVRLEAVDGMRSLSIPATREILNELLVHDPDLFVRIEVVKVFREVGTTDWAPPLVRLLLDETEDPSLRFQAYLSAVALTGSDLMFLREDWEAWLKQHG